MAKQKRKEIHEVQRTSKTKKNYKKGHGEQEEDEQMKKVKDENMVIRERWTATKEGEQRKQKYRRYTKKVIAKIKQEVSVKETGTNMRDRQEVNSIQFNLYRAKLQ